MPGDRSPPPAPKHATAASSRPRAPRQQQPVRRPERYDTASVRQYREDGTPDNVSVVSDSAMEEDGFNSQYTNPRKRKRTNDQMSVQDQQHRIWADSLLDYFMLLESEDPIRPPTAPPPGVSLDKPIDDKGHTALHWAAAMGDLDIVKQLIAGGARIDSVSNNLETPLMRAVLFTNNYDKKTMPKLARILAPTVRKTDWFGSTVFHHIAATTSSKNKYACARYYFDSVINVLLETWIPSEVTELLNKRDKNGDTALHICANTGARKCVRTLLGRSVAMDVPNSQGVTADDLIRQLNERRARHFHESYGGGRELSSSPFAPNGRGVNGDGVPAPTSLPMPAIPEIHYRSETATELMSKILPKYVEWCRELAEVYEEDFKKEEHQVQELDRALTKRTVELESLKRVAMGNGERLEQLEREYLDATLMQTDEMEERELQALTQEAEGLMEIESAEELQSLAGPNGVVNGNQLGSMGPPATNGTCDVRYLGQKLANAQKERQRLVKESVKSMSVAGLGEKQADYKRLLRTALGVKEQEVDGMLNELLKELEEDKARSRYEES